MLVSLLPAQVELVYRRGEEAFRIVGFDKGRPVYEDEGQRQPLPADGEWEFRPIGQYAEAEATVETYSRLRQTRHKIRGELAIEVTSDITIRAASELKGLQLAMAWNNDGQDIHFLVLECPEFAAGETKNLSAKFTIAASESGGFLRTYVMQNGRSLRMVGRKEMAALPLRAALDAGDFAAASVWLQGPGRDGRALTPALLERMTRMGNASLLAAAFAVKDIKRIKGKEGAALLMAAAENGRADCVKLLLKMGADAKARDAQGYSALFRAVRAGSISTMLRLLEAGADPERPAVKFGETPLVFAMQQHNLPATQLLVAYGAKWPGKDKLNALMVGAVRRGDTDWASYLLNHGADPNALSGLHRPLVIAAFQGDERMMQVLLEEGANPELAGTNGATAFMGAAASGNESCIAMLPSDGGTVTDADGRTAAAWAALSGHAELAVRLIEKSAPTGTVATRILHDAYLAGLSNVTEVLMQRGAVFNLNASDMDRILDEIVRTNDLAVLAHLLAHGLDVNRRVFGGWSLSGLAKRYGSAATVQELERRAIGHTLETIAPPVAKLPVQLLRRGPGISPDALDPTIERAEAVIDVYVDPNGVPHAPVVKSTTAENFGKLVALSLLEWRFNRLESKAGQWRRVAVPLQFSRRDLRASAIHLIWEVDQAPYLINNPPLPEDATACQAVHVRFVVNERGSAVSPEVLSATAPGLEKAARECLAGWRFLPATKEDTKVGMRLEGVVLLPSGTFAEIDLPMTLGKKKTQDWVAPTLISSPSTQSDRRGAIATALRGIVLVGFKVDTSGYTRAVEVLASSDKALEDRAVKVCQDMIFEPAKIAGTPVACGMLRAVVIGNTAVATPQ